MRKKCCPSCCCCCCKSLQAIRLCIVIFGIVTVSLGAFAYLTSPYTKKYAHPDYKQYFKTWERIHGVYPDNSENVTESSNSTIDVEESTPFSQGNETMGSNETTTGSSGNAEPISESPSPEMQSTTLNSNGGDDTNGNRRKRAETLESTSTSDISTSENSLQVSSSPITNPPTTTAPIIVTTTAPPTTTSGSNTQTTPTDTSESSTDDELGDTTTMELEDTTIENSNTTSTNSTTNETHSIIDDAIKTIEGLPQVMENGYESCRSFQSFLQELTRRLATLGMNAEFNVSTGFSIGFELLDDLQIIEYCPNILYERSFLGVSLICLFLTTICVSLTMLCCPTQTAGLINKSIDVSYHFLCGLALLGTIVVTVIFLYRLDAVCEAVPTLYTHFHRAMTDFQINWHKLREEPHLHVIYNKEKYEKLQEINEQLLPKYYEFLKEFRRYQQQKAQGNTSVEFEIGGNVHFRKKVKKKRTFSWIKSIYYNQKKPNTTQGESVFRLWMYLFNAGTLACEIYTKFFWKAGAVFFGIIMTALYFAASVRALHKEENHETYVIIREQVKSSEGNTKNVHQQEPTQSIATEDADINNNPNYNNSTAVRTENKKRTGCCRSRK